MRLWTVESGFESLRPNQMYDFRARPGISSDTAAYAAPVRGKGRPL